jgi:sugar O-acyltransferase (sialic acid O-acetyltransferase NeuD family)
MNLPLILIGGGGHCKACIDVIEQEGRLHIAGILDVPEKVGQTVFGYSVLATDEQLPDLARTHCFLITIGQIHTAATRIRLYQELTRISGELPAIVSPRAYVSPHAEIGRGTIVMHGASINASARVGHNCIINSHALVEHDAVIDDHCHVATGAIINGGVRIGEQSKSFIAAGTGIYADLPELSKVKPK